MPLTATPPRPHPRRRPRPSFTLTPSSASPSPSSSQAHGARGRAAPDLAGCPDPGPRARVAAASRPRAVHTPCAPARRGLSRPHAGSALRACDPCYGKAAWATRWHWVGERWRLAVTTGCAGVLDATPHARGRVPARHAPSAVGDAHDAPCCAVWQARAAAAPWRAPPGGLGAPPRRARGLWTPSVVCVRRCAAAWGAQEALGARAPLHPDRRRRALIGGTFFCPRSHTRPKYR